MLERFSFQVQGLQAVVPELLCEALWPTSCISCGKAGELLCERCRSLLDWIDPRWSCTNCGAPYGYMCCTQCQGRWGLKRIMAACSFNQIAASVVVGLKDLHERRLASVMAAALQLSYEEHKNWAYLQAGQRVPALMTSETSFSLLKEESLGTASHKSFTFDPDLVCFVPATAEAYRRRGFDHMELVSRSFCEITGLYYADILSRTSRYDQRKLSREERQANLASSLLVHGQLSSLRILLLDDVLTTGASLRAAAQALYQRGAQEVSGLVFARVW